MINQFNINKIMKQTSAFLLSTVTTFGVFAFGGSNKKDTVIIELDKTSKIVIITKDKNDLASLENYDINRMLKDLNARLTDSVRYMEINDSTSYVNKKEAEMKNRKIDDDEVRIRLGGLEVGIDPDEVDDWDDDSWEHRKGWLGRKKITYRTDTAVDKTSYHFNIDLGINNWLEDGQFPDGSNAPYSVKPLGSWYVALNSVNRTQIGNPLFFLEWGLGISWYNWKMQDADVQITEGTEMIEFTEVAAPLSGIKSKLTASYLNAQVVPMFNFSKGRKKIVNYESLGFKIRRYDYKTGFRFGAGGYVGYRLGSHTKFRFKDNGDNQKDKESDNFFLENFRYGVRGQVGWKGVELFVMYDLNDVFASGRGPFNPETGENSALNAITFGITL